MNKGQNLGRTKDGTKNERETDQRLEMIQLKGLISYDSEKKKNLTQIVRVDLSFYPLFIHYP